MRILVNYDGNSDECIKAAFKYFGDRVTDLLIHTAVPPVPYCSAMEILMCDPSYAEEIDQKYYKQKSLDKQIECELFYPEISIESILSNGFSTSSILSSCKEKDPDLLILCRGEKSFNIIGLCDDRWGIVRKRCQKPILEIKKSS